MGSMIVWGLSSAAFFFGARYVLRSMPKIEAVMSEAAKNIPKMDPQALANSKYYKGGFDDKMTKREAALILAISTNASPLKMKAAYKRLILLNHPDKGGSPYLSAKISQAKDLMEKKRE